MSLEINTCKRELRGKHKETEDHGSLILEQILMPQGRILKKGLFLNNKTSLLLNSGSLMVIL